jgi:hypothetical protein
MFDGPGWNETMEKERDNLAPATGVAVPLPLPVQLGVVYARMMMMFWTPWLLPRNPKE